MHVKLELVEDDHTQAIIDQVDLVCPSNNSSCPFEYIFGATRVNASVLYRLEAVMSESRLPPRKSVTEAHPHKIAHSIKHARKFKVNPNTDTVINNYEIIVTRSS
jgi:hypothetical protein